MKQIFAAIRELFAYSVSSDGFVTSGTVSYTHLTLPTNSRV